MKMEQSVLKCRHIKFRRWGIWHLPAYEDGTECSETSAYKIQAPRNLTPTCLWRRGRQSVPKRRHIKFRRRGILHLPAYEDGGRQSVPKRRHIKFRRRGIWHLLAYEDGTECSETSAYKFQAPRNLTPTRPWRWGRQSVPKRRHIKFRRWGITQKKTYNIQNMAKVWNQEDRQTDRQCTYNVTLRPVSANIVAVEKQ
jgi:hypothetical protein